MSKSPEARPSLPGRFASRIREALGRQGNDRDAARKSAKKILGYCHSTVSSFEECYGDVYNQYIPNFYLNILLGTALEEAVFNCFYRDEDAEDPPGITRIPLAKRVFLETDRLLEEKRLKMYDAILPYVRGFKKNKQETTAGLIYFYQAEVLPKAKAITADFQVMYDMREDGLREKIAYAIDKSVASMLPSANELGI